jgi:hypothetical protein
LNQRIAEYDRRIEQMAKEVYPEVALLKQVKGVGTRHQSGAYDCDSMSGPAISRLTAAAF